MQSALTMVLFRENLNMRERGANPSTCADVVTSFHDEGAVLLDISSGLVFATNRIGSCIWRGLTLGHSPSRIALEISQKYPVDPAVALADVCRFVDRLRQQKLQQPCGASL